MLSKCGDLRFSDELFSLSPTEGIGWQLHLCSARVSSVPVPVAGGTQISGVLVLFIVSCKLWSELSTTPSIILGSSAAGWCDCLSKKCSAVYKWSWKFTYLYT